MSNEWRTHLQQQFEELDLLSKDDFKVYLVLLESREEMVGHQLTEDLPAMKRTTIYSILTRLQKQGWIEITNPGSRPAQYRALDPLRSVEQAIDEHQQHVDKLSQLRDYITSTVMPIISEKTLFGGRVSRTFILNGIEDFKQQLADAFTQAEQRIMAHSPYSTIDQFSKPLGGGIYRILKKFSSHSANSSQMEQDIIITDWDFHQQHLAITVARESEKEKVDLPIKVAYDPNLLRSQVFVIDNIVFLYLLDAPVLSTGIQIGLGLKIEDISVANAYAHHLSHIFQEMWIINLPTPTLEAIDKRIANDQELMKGVEKLIQQGWQLLHEETHPEIPYISLVAPSPVFSAFRESGISYIPLKENDNPNKLRQESFKEIVNHFVQELNRETERENFTATWFDSTVILLGVECLTRHFVISYPEHFVSAGLFSDVNLDYFNPTLPSDPPSCAVFIYHDRAVVTVWAVYPLNVVTIMKAILGIE